MRHRKAILIFMLTSLFSLLLAVGISATENKQINLVPPVLQLPNHNEMSKPIDESSRITVLDNRPVAQLEEIPANLKQGLSVAFPEMGTEKQTADEISYTILASVEYRGQTDAVLITTSRASALANTQNTSWGNQIVKLPNGQTGWMTENLPSDMSNQLIWHENGVIITMLSNQSVETLYELSSQVVLVEE